MTNYSGYTAGSGAGGQYDRYLSHNEQSKIHKMKETYWTTKQMVLKKLGKKEDEHIVASDSQLDSKLEVFRAIQRSSIELLKIIEKYQDRLCFLAQEESSMGRYLKQQSHADKTRAGKMMAAVGKSMAFSSQQRIALRVPLVRLYQEVETFRYRAITDTLWTINKMEVARSEYRGALMWMKAASEELNPDTYKQMEKFRKVQAQVRKTKTRFDKLKLDTMQKIDLLAASRCNMFSHVLANYQTTLLHFWDKTSRTMNAVADSFKGYQHYEFALLKDLTETSKKLAEDTGSPEQIEKPTDGVIDHEGDRYKESKANEAVQDDEPLINIDDLLSTEQGRSNWVRSDGDDELIDAGYRLPGPISLSENLYPQQNNFISQNQVTNYQNHGSGHVPRDIGDNSTVGDVTKQASGDTDDVTQPLLIELGEEAASTGRRIKQADLDSLGSMSNLLDALDKELGLTDPGAGREEQTIEDIRRQQDQDLDFTGHLQQVAQERNKKKELKNVPSDLLLEDFDQDEPEKDDMAQLNEILNAPSGEGEEFSMEWTGLFGAGTAVTPTSADPMGHAPGSFMPSALLDLKPMQDSAQANAPKTAAPTKPSTAQATSKQQKSKKGQKQDMSAWFNLFADLDPLANPDAIGRKDISDA